LQKRIIPTFHYALKAGGFLFLGASESIGPFTELFEPADKKQKIFCKKPGPTPAFRLPMPKGRVASPAAARHPVFPIARAPDLPESLRTEADAQREADRLALNQFAPPGVLVDAELHVLQFRGATGMYLEPPTGRASFDVLKMAREGLAVPLRAALKKAERENKPVRTKNVRIQQNGGTRGLNLHVIPLKSLKERYYLVWFEPADGPRAGGTPASAPPAKPPASRPVPRQVADLKRELSETRAYLQSLQDQHAAAEEELQAFNEEVQSANEELQSINEELETSKEELESANEELITVNDELLNRNAELDRSNADLNNLQVSINTSILLLGRDLTVRRFTPAAGDLFALAAGDVGRPLGNIRHDLDLPDLEALVAEVIDTVSVREREVQTKDGRWYVLRARPYMTLDNKIDGAVLVLVDIDALKRTEREITVARDYAEAILRTTRYPLVVLREDLRVDTANAAFYKTFRVAPGQTEGRSIYELGSGQWNIPRLRELLEDILPRNSFFDDFEVTHDFESLGRRIMLLNARRLDTDEKDSPRRILLAIDDITEGKQLEDLRLSEMRYRRLFEAAKDGILVLDPHTQKITDANPVMMELLDFTREEVIGKELWEIGLLKDKPASHEAFRELRTTGGARYELPLQTKAGQRREVEVVANLYHEDGEQVIQCNIRDITERKHAVDELARHRLHLEELVAERTDSLKQSLERLRRSERLASIGTLAAGIAHEINNPLNSIVLMSECCLRGKGPVDPMEMLQKIKSEAVRGGRIVKNVLKFAKDERTSKSPADLNDVVRHATSLVSFYAQSAAVDIQVELAPDLPPVMMNPVEIELVLINLIKNAAEAGSARTHVVVRTAWDSQKVTLTVADDGSGMPQDIQAHIFDPFFTTKRGSGGSGLGLSLCHGIVSEHGGEISVHSQVGSGSTFTVELPAAQDGERTLEP
jgi:PAS domain S-box-containing protein